ncbi:hypothetical protein BGZ80_008747 [Entomortierella chlamydospora]|uniref:NADP-dependent oxidoreductase domain-containing protein n=1 Tax=Entomortierella chlamydospora TaxID=101097 RepID=A0A9P6MY25_9FUNG|nr:hypothetical protein BGZ80_008747 [Entomortierella chlamydospora]
MTRVNLSGLQSFCTLNNGRNIPLLGLGVYLIEAGKATEDAVLWALQIFVTTKLYDQDHGYDSALAACELSLQKLGLDYVDLYLIHSPNPGAERRAESWNALQKLVTLGKAKSIGKAYFYSITPMNLLNFKVHPWLARREIISFCESQNIAIEAYSPLSRGHKLQDPVVNKIAAKYSKSAAQVLIRWSLQKGHIVLPKSAKKERIEQNSEVFDFELADGDMEVLDSLDEGYVSGWDPTTAP